MNTDKEFDVTKWLDTAAPEGGAGQSETEKAAAALAAAAAQQAAGTGGEGSGGAGEEGAGAKGGENVDLDEQDWDEIDLDEEEEEETAEQKVAREAAEAAAAAAETQTDEEEEAKAIAYINKKFGKSIKAIDEIIKSGAVDTPKTYLDAQEQKTLEAINYFLTQPIEVRVKAQIRQEMLEGGLVEAKLDENGDEVKDANGNVVMDVNEDDLEFEYNNLKKDVLKFNRYQKDIERQLQLRKDALVKKENELRTEDENKAVESSKKNRKELEVAFKKMNTFMGVELDSATRHRMYQKTVSGKFFEELTADQNKIAEVVAFMELKAKIAEAKMEDSFNQGKMALFQNIFKSQPSRQGRQIATQAKGGTFTPDMWGQ